MCVFVERKGEGWNVFSRGSFHAYFLLFLNILLLLIIVSRPMCISHGTVILVIKDIHHVNISKISIMSIYPSCQYLKDIHQVNSQNTMLQSVRVIPRKGSTTLHGSWLVPQHYCPTANWDRTFVPLCDPKNVETRRLLLRMGQVSYWDDEHSNILEQRKRRNYIIFL